MSTLDPRFFEMQPESEEWRKEGEQLTARVAAVTSFSRKYPGVYEQLQESFTLRRTIEASMLRLDRIGPRFFDAAAATARSRAFVEGIEHEMRHIEAMSAACAKRNDAAPPVSAPFTSIGLSPSPAAMAARRRAAVEKLIADRDAAAEATLASPAQRRVRPDPDDDAPLHTGQYL